LRLAKVVGGERGGLRLTAGSFHEGLCDLTIDAAGAIAERDEARLLAFDSRRFRLTCARSQPALFRWVGDVDAWVAGRLLGGAWADERGRRVVFDAAGQAQLAATKVAYSVCLDMKTCEGDTLYLGKSTYSFTIAGRQLTLVPSGPARGAG